MKKLLTLLLFVVVLGYGWILNLTALLNLEPFVWTAKTVIATGGVFISPVGTIMGYFVW